MAIELWNVDASGTGFSLHLLKPHPLSLSLSLRQIQQSRYDDVAMTARAGYLYYRVHSGRPCATDAYATTHHYVEMTAVARRAPACEQLAHVSICARDYLHAKVSATVLTRFTKRCLDILCRICGLRSRHLTSRNCSSTHELRRTITMSVNVRTDLLQPHQSIRSHILHRITMAASSRN